MHLRKNASRGVITATAVVLLATASLTTAAGSEVEREAPLTAKPMSTWQTDGIVYALEYARGVVYVGGTFSNVRPPGAAPGEKEVARKNFAAFDAVTGKLLPCTHSFSGAGDTVRALKASGDGHVLYVGGSFSKVGNTSVERAVALDTAKCSLRKDFRPKVTAMVRAIETTKTAVYLGGDFTIVDGQPRQRLAAFKPGGSLLPFRAAIDKPVRALVAALAHEKLLVGGDFETVNGSQARSLTALNPSTGATVGSYPDWLPPRSVVKSLARDDKRFYVGAEGFGTGIFDGRIAGTLADNRMVWKDMCWGATQAVVPYKGILYSGSHAHDCSVTPGGFPEHNDRQHLLAQSVTDKRILHWFPDTDGGIGEGAGPRALEIAKGILWVGGEFTRVNAQAQQGLTRFGAGGGSKAPEAATQLKVAEAAPGRIVLSWRASWDRDDAELTYLIYRDGKLVASPSHRSAMWNRPTLTYTDSVAPGSRHRYTIAVTDGENKSSQSTPISVTAGGSLGEAH
jgi:hypothetical protein